MSVGRGQHSTVFGLALLLSISAACSDESAPSKLTQIVVVVDSDIRVPDELDGIEISVTGTVKSSRVEDKLDAEHPLPRSLGVVHSGGPLGPLRVTAIGRLAGESVVERVATVYFKKDRTLKLALPLMHSCLRADLGCGSDQTCDRGACVAAAVSDLPVFEGDDGPFADASAWAAPVLDAGHDAGTETVVLPTDAGQDGQQDQQDQDAAADSGEKADAAEPPPMITCSIVRPKAGDSFYVGDEISFEGSCNKADGEVPARWRSDQDGALGQSSAFTKSDLRVGGHEISLCADGTNPVCASMVTIKVQELPDISATISSLAQSGKTDGVYSADAELVAKGAGTGVPPLKYRWLDSFWGELAAGDTTHYAAPMLAGRHSVRLIVTDARGRSAKAERTFEVHAPGHDTLFESYTFLNNVLGEGDGNTISALTSGSGFHHVGTEKGWLLSVAAAGPPESTGTKIAMASQGAGSSLPSVRDVFLRAGKLYLATNRDVQSCNVSGDNITACTVQTLNGLTASSIPRSLRVVSSADTDYLVVGTSLGLWTGSMSALDKGALRENNTVFSGLTESAGSLWIAASAGLYTYTLGAALTANPKKIGNGPSGLTALASSAGIIWTALSEGMASYDATAKTWTTWTTNYDAALFGRLVSNDVRTVAITHPVIDGVAHDVIWIGTASGLSRFDPAIPSFTTYTRADGLPDNAVLRAIGLPSNELLLATQSGLAIHRGQ